MIQLHTYIVVMGLGMSGVGSDIQIMCRDPGTCYPSHNTMKYNSYNLNTAHPTLPAVISTCSLILQVSITTVSLMSYNQMLIEPKNILVAGQSCDEATAQNISGFVYFNISTTKTLFCHKKAVCSSALLLRDEMK